MELEESRCLWRLCLNGPSGDMGEKGDCNGLASEMGGEKHRQEVTCSCSQSGLEEN